MLWPPGLTVTSQRSARNASGTPKPCTHASWCRTYIGRHIDVVGFGKKDLICRIWVVAGRIVRCGDEGRLLGRERHGAQARDDG